MVVNNSCIAYLLDFFQEPSAKTLNIFNRILIHESNVLPIRSVLLKIAWYCIICPRDVVTDCLLKLKRGIICWTSINRFKAHDVKVTLICSAYSMHSVFVLEEKVDSHLSCNFTIFNHITHSTHNLVIDTIKILQQMLQKF